MVGQFCKRLLQKHETVPFTRVTMAALAQTDAHTMQTTSRLTHLPYLHLPSLVSYFLHEHC